jgi:hypothetical protein
MFTAESTACSRHVEECVFARRCGIPRGPREPPARRTRWRDPSSWPSAGGNRLHGESWPATTVLSLLSGEEPAARRSPRHTNPHANGSQEGQPSHQLKTNAANGPILPHILTRFRTEPLLWPTYPFPTEQLTGFWQIAYNDQGQGVFMPGKGPGESRREDRV